MAQHFLPMMQERTIRLEVTRGLLCFHNKENRGCLVKIELSSGEVVYQGIIPPKAEDPLRVSLNKVRGTAPITVIISKPLGSKELRLLKKSKIFMRLALKYFEMKEEVTFDIAS